MKKDSTLPPPTLERLARLYVLLGKLQNLGLQAISSKRLSELLGVPDHTIRKDLSFLKEGQGIEPFAEKEKAGVGKPGSGVGRGYPLESLRLLIGARLGLTHPRTACLVGLGNLGVAILNRRIWQEGVYRLVAAFDLSENRLELLSTKIPLYHARELERVVRNYRIEIGILTVPPEAAQETADRLVHAGIRGIINFAPVVLTVKSNRVVVRNVSLAGELNILSAYLYQQEEETHG
ncbi:MAG: redox-sensing transcriptional repressor Rex [Spirochaetes bacterium]|nr:redox-sensing transcriptional repressor Rex [Spirochaetota bacterium]